MPTMGAWALGLAGEGAGVATEGPGKPRVGLLKSLLSYASLLSKASILGVFGFSHSLNFLRAPQQSLGMEWGWHLLDHRLCFPF